MFYLAFVILIMANANYQAINILNLTPEQEAILATPPADAIAFLNQAIVLSSISSTYFIVNLVTVLLGIIWIIAVAKAVKEIIPVLPS